MNLKLKSDRLAEDRNRMADFIDDISRCLIEGKRDSEKRVQDKHRDGNQIIYGGQRRYDAEDTRTSADNCPIEECWHWLQCGDPACDTCTAGVNPHTCIFQTEGKCTQRADRADVFDCLPENCPRCK